MRVTNRMLTMSVVNNIHYNQAKLNKTNDMLSSGRKISIPSDDPSGTVKAMGYRSNLVEIEQYISNVDSAENFLKATDTAMDQITNIVQRVRELSVEAANDTYEQSSRDAIATEITELIDEVVGISNSRVGNRYIFGGYETTEAPFTLYDGENDFAVSGPGPDLVDVNGNTRTDINASNATVVRYDGDSGRLQVEIDENVITSYNISGQEMFVDGIDVFETLINMRDNIYKGDVVLDNDGDGTSMEDGIDKIEQVINKLLRYRSEVGAKLHRMEQAHEKLETQNINITDLLSKTEDTDVTEAIMDLKVQESVQRMSLSVGARVIQPTLIDFLS